MHMSLRGMRKKSFPNWRPEKAVFHVEHFAGDHLLIGALSRGMTIFISM